MKILYVTTIGRTMRFFEPFIKELILDGHSVDIATNENNSMVPECYREWSCNIYQVDFSRSPLSFDNIRAYGQFKKLIENGNYDIVHCHTPNASVVTRLVCNRFRKKTGLKVFYTAHGFHFYKGAPVLNWLLFYPIEKFCSHFMDKLITINKEDYELAKNKFKVNEVYYVPGVGIDLSKFENIQVDRNAKRKEIGVPEDAILLLSVGELNENKNHQIVINAMAEMKEPSVHYAIAGFGDKREYLISLSKELGVEDCVHLLGYRKDVAELYKASDVYVLPSLREGLNVSVMEAMASGLPCVVSKIRGNVDLIDERGGECFNAYDRDNFSQQIKKIIISERSELSAYNKCKIEKFEVSNVIAEMKKIYGI